jgi:hypothetical protein
MTNILDTIFDDIKPSSVFDGKCPYCKKPFIKQKDDQQFCSGNCRYHFNKEKEVKTAPATDLFPNTVDLPEGITWDEKRHQFRTAINVNDKEIVLGRFYFLQSALQVRKSAEIRYGLAHNDAPLIAPTKDLFS